MFEKTLRVQKFNDIIQLSLKNQTGRGGEIHEEGYSRIR